MKICVNGNLREMTIEETTAYNDLDEAILLAPKSPEELIIDQMQEIESLKKIIAQLLVNSKNNM